MKILVLGLLHLPLETVEFSYCELHDKAGLCIGKLLQDVHSIKSLELEGNYLGKNGLEPIAFAMRGYEGALEYYGIFFHKKSAIKTTQLTVRSHLKEFLISSRSRA